MLLDKNVTIHLDKSSTSRKQKFHGLGW